MTIKELNQLVEDSKELLIINFKSEYKRTPKDGELLDYVKNLYKNGEEDDILSDLFLDDVECPEDFSKLLLLFAAKD